MGFGEVAASAIMFIAILSSATLVVFIYNNYVTATTASVNTRQDYMAEQIKTSITIEHVSYDDTSDQIRMYTRNTGKSILKISQLSVYISNDRVSDSSANTSVSITSDTDTINTGLWDPNEVLEIVSNKTLVSGNTYTAIIVTHYGVKDEYSFSA